MKYRKFLALGLSAALCLSTLSACGGAGSSGGEEQVVIYSNADEEAITAMQNALDNNGYKGKYIFQTYGTSELGGKLLAEGTNLEADLVTMSTFYLQSAQDQNSMFLPLTFDVNTLTEVPDYTAPITSQEGAIILNTELMASEGLPIDYVDPAEGNFSLTESVAVLDKGEDTNPLAMEMAQCIIENGREELLQTYPNPLYEGETADPANQSAHPSVFGEPLTFELFQAHQQLSEAAKG